MKKLSVTIGIPAFLAENNIKFLIYSLLKQKGNNFYLSKIKVYYDQSGDKTIQKVKEIKDERVEIIDGKIRKGFAHGVKRLLSMNKSDILLLLNDDIKIIDNKFIHKIVQSFDSEANIGLACGNPQPLKPKTFIDKALCSRLKANENLSHHINNGNNIFSCDGKVLALHKNLIHKLNLPKNNKELGNVDAFLYFACITNGFNFKFIQDAYVYFRNPTTWKDYTKWISRNNMQKYILYKNFNIDLVKHEFARPKLILLHSMLIQFIKNPYGCLFIALTEIYNIFKAKVMLNDYDDKWDVVTTTKNLN